MENKLKEWKEQWNDGDSKFIPELFEYVESLELELAKLVDFERLFINLDQMFEENRILLENKKLHDQNDLINMKKRGIINTDEYWTRYQENEAYEKFMRRMDKEY